MVKPNRNILIFILIGFLSVLLYALYIRSAKVKTVPVDLDITFDLEYAGVDASSCTDEEALTYLYYAGAPDEPRNNKFGLYVYAENRDFINLAADMVNSNGGDWGYVLLPYNVKDDDYTKWRRAFELLHERHLIPIVQLHDIDPKKYEEQTRDAAEFLNTLLWPVRPRYISVYNEPNSADFWYGYINPSEYANILDETITVFKDVNPNFFIMNGAFNVSAPNSQGYMDSFDYMYRMNLAVPGIFERLDGWASHSYPQPNFSGSPFDSGRWSISAYDSELRFLKNSLGVEEDLPVFITETGWAHAEGEEYNSSFLSVDRVGENIRAAYEHVWLEDDRVVAVTPFTIWFESPYDHFSWVKDDKTPYDHYEVVKSMEKIAGTPEVLSEATLRPTCSQ